MRLFTLYLGSQDGQKPAAQEVLALAGQRFESFTLSEAQGVFRGTREPMWLIRIATDNPESLLQLAAELRQRWHQDGVGIEAGGNYYRVTATVDLMQLLPRLAAPSVA
jgi:hypothetical protein